MTNPIVFRCRAEDEHLVGTWEPGGIPDDVTHHTRVAPRLYLGAHPMYGRLPDDVDVVVNVDTAKPYGVRNGVLQINFPFDDSDELPNMADLRLLAHWVNVLRRGGKTVYVHCRLGINRSALLVALVLRDDGVEPERAISLLRRARDPYVLCNATFEEAVLNS